MASLFDMLSGSLGSEEEYLAKNPFFQGARSVGSWNIQPQTNAEAIWGPALQGLLGGALAGYGRKDARQEAFQDAKTNPYLSQFETYQSEEPPSGWTPKVGQRDLLLQGIQQEAAQKKQEQELKARLDLKKLLAAKNLTLDEEDDIIPLKNAAEMEAQQEIAKREALLPILKRETRIRGKNDPRGANINVDTGLGAADTTKVINSDVIIREVGSIADDIEKNKLTWKGLQGAKLLSALDEFGIVARLESAKDLLGTARTGATLTTEQAKVYNQITKGDVSAGPQKIVQLLRTLAENEAKNSIARAETAEILKTKGTAGLKDRYAGVVNKISNTSPEYEVRTLPNGQKVRVLLGK